jgi:DNA-binding FadR family transcriptional regulator
MEKALTMSNEAMPGLIRRPNLVELVHEAIEEAFRRGEFGADGCQFTEAALCRKFNVSRPTVREALIRLRAKGALPHFREGSASAAALPARQIGAPRYQALSSIADLRQHVEFRCTVELGAVRLCALNRDAGDIERMEAAFHALHAGTDCSRNSAAADFRFHLAIAQATKNPVFASVMESLRAHALFTMNLSRQFTSLHGRTERSSQIETEHRMILDAILARDEARALAAMRLHIGNTAARVFGCSDENKKWQPANAAA